MRLEGWPVPRYLLAVAAGAFMLAWIHFRFVLLPVGVSTDEAWMVHVTRRMIAGETLYRDTFAGTTPLSFYVQAWLGAWLGAELVLLRVVLHLLFVATLVATAATADALRIPRHLGLAAAAGAAIWTRPAPTSLYSAWSLLFLVGTMLLAARLPGARRPLPIALVAGAMAGLAFAAKQNVGLLAIAALLAVLPAARPADWRRLALGALAGFTVAAGAWLVPIAASGAWPWFVEQGFTGKGSYIREAAIPYLRYAQFGPHGLLYLLPLAIPVAAIAAWRARGEVRGHAAVVAAFALAGLGSAFPRPDFLHMVLAGPPLAIAAAFALSLVRTGRSFRTAVAALALLVATVEFGRLAVREGGKGPFVRFDFSGVAGIPAKAGDAAAFSDTVRVMASLAPSGGMLVLHPGAPRYYLAAGIRNPSRYDYPLVTTFGRSGEEEVVEAIRAGRIGTVCLHEPDWPSMVPARLVAHVEAEMRRGAAAGPCRLFTGSEPELVGVAPRR